MCNILNLVVDRASYYPMHSLITSYLDIIDIFRLSRVCKQTSDIYSDIQKTQWNINAQLRSYFKDVDAFRTLQGKTGTLIGGRFAFCFFRRLRKDNVLRLFVQAGENAEAIYDFLERERYSIISDKVSQDAENNSGLNRFSILQKPATQNHGPVLLSVSQTIETPLDAVLRNMLCTSQGCFLSWNKAYCLFPIATFTNQESYLMTPLRNDTATNTTLTRAVLQTEAQYGLKIKPPIWHPNANPSPDHTELGPYRCIGDKHTWTMHLDTTHIPAPQTPDLVLDMASFCITKTKEDSLATYLTLDYSLKKSCVLRYTYITAVNTETWHGVNGWHGMTGEAAYAVLKVQGKLDETTLMQLALLEPNERPTEYAAIVDDVGSANTAMGKFRVPATWVYYDEEVQRCLGEFHRDFVKRQDGSQHAGVGPRWVRGFYGD
ncbi:hypothetical protein P153DRAFT_435283 [Dothidotthia symphoricarpi CBS 119687]|uniref:F-box domain-containing protein n=1 Tax=Dothidotthia symphoricarpi CBS 119687 TaxID=1392245 RepID=A0A6A6A1W7_9PLEO|nr:uncharacterized protein P153DRAFT_435283 [Dothidotthia symphoricarpi CBS 119687]KAF2124561.1 hypothetical protein P153DRAFT_435283 [Dothidotthia symphoricarpi CBS 119687]